MRDSLVSSGRRATFGNESTAPLTSLMRSIDLVSDLFQSAETSLPPGRSFRRRLDDEADEVDELRARSGGGEVGCVVGWSDDELGVGDFESVGWVERMSDRIATRSA